VLSRIAGISGLYDGVVGALLLCAPAWLAEAFGVPAASPRVFSDLNGLFLLAVGAGYYLPWREPARYRGYLWVMGPFLKGAGALTFLADYFLRGSPRSFLLFAASDGLLAVITLYALLASPAAPR
jgi:thiol:disulfide interchange protein